MQKENKRIIEISNQLLNASTGVRILRNVAWPQYVKETFFKYHCERLPSIKYNVYDPSPVLNQIKTVRKLINSSGIIDEWASRIADTIENSCLMLSSRGTPDFFKYSQILYGKPADSLQNGIISTLELANHFDQIFESVKHVDLGAPPNVCILAQSIASDMKKVVIDKFGEYAPEIVMDENLSSNALAGRRRVSIRPSACFTDKDIDQLIHHELYVHVATSINGYLQPHLKILGEGHAGTTKTQEGLAVFAEFITGSFDLDRVRRLSDRVIAIQMAIEGADFIEVYRYYLEKIDNPEQSFESAKRVFRGGVIKGSAPFTKDIVYLEGLLTVHNFLRVAIRKGKLEYLDLLFSGKLDISDLPALKKLAKMGLIEKPKFLPPWIEDKRFLLSYLSYSSFLNTIDLNQLKVYYENILDQDL